MEHITYQQVLADMYEDTPKNLLVSHNEYEEEVELYEKETFEENDLPDKEEFNKFHGDRNKPEHVIVPEAKDSILGSSKHPVDIRNIIVNIDGNFRGNITPIPGPSENANPGSLSSYFLFLTAKLHKNISSVKLTSFEFLNSFYTFSTQRGNTTFYISLSSNLIVKHKITIPSGNYPSYCSFAEAIQTAMQAIPVLTAFSCTHDVIAHSITISGSEPFTLTFPDSTTNAFGNGIGYNMGFLNKTYTASSSTITSDQAPDIFQDTYIYLSINDWNLVEHHVYGQTHYSAFAKIQLQGPKNSIIFDNNYTNSSSKEYVFHQPVNINRLEIKLLDAYGNVLDCRGSNFSMTLEMKQVYSSEVYEKLLAL